MTPIPGQMLLDRQADRKATLSGDARFDLAAQLGIYFSGLILYVQDVSCPHCGAMLQADDFVADSDKVDQDQPPLPEMR